jgi:hypothetical protein
MKTSNKLITIAAILTLLALFTYDFLLKSEYSSGNFSDPYHYYTSIPFKDFDRIDMKSSTAANVRLIQGPFSVRMDPDAEQYVKIQQTGNVLQVIADFKGNYLGNPHPYTLIISCPSLREISTNATYRTNNREYTDTIVHPEWRMRQVLVDGFTQDSMHIEQDYGSTVVLENNKIRSVHAVIGKSKGSGSDIIIKNNNRFGDFSLSASNQARFILENADIINLSYQLGDSATLMVKGNARHLLYNLKNN